MVTTNLTIPGETAVITAAGRGIGLEIAHQLTSAGINVAINDMNQERLEEASTFLASNEGDVVTSIGDASKPESMSNLIDTAIEAFESLDILVNNVGVTGPWKPIAEMTNQEFMDTLAVNLGGVFNATVAAIPYIKEGTNGRIINMSSRLAKEPLPERGPYSISKMGVIALTRTLALELGDHDVTVNAICPGPVRGERVDNALKDSADTWDLDENDSFEDILQKLRNKSPINQLLEANDVADTVLFLCSSRASKITGQDINVTAGRRMG